MLDIKEYLKQTRTVLVTQDAFDELVEKASAQPEQQWIPVVKKPIEKGLMLVTYNDGDVDLLKQPTAYRRSDIVAWMPLPEPYKERREE